MTERPYLSLVAPTGERVAVPPLALERLVDAAFESRDAGDRRLLRDLLLADAEPGVLWAALHRGDAS